jgi:hypothetical protein
VLLATPLVLLAGAELLARALLTPNSADDPELVLLDVPSFFERTTVDGVEVWAVDHPEAYRARQVRIPVHKPERAFRVFCLGESASAGWPHPPSEIFSAYLEQALQRAWPERTLEVYNVSAHAYAAYRVRLIFEQVLEFEPDLLVLWTGNNEFLESRSYRTWLPALRRVDQAARRLQLYRWLESVIAPALFPDRTLSARQREGETAGLESKLSQMALPLRSDPEQFEAVLRHYRETVQAMARAARARGVPLLLLTVPVNLRDWEPNASRSALAGDERARFQGALDGGRGSLLRGRPEEAVELLERAVALDPGHAHARFHLARALEAHGDPVAAAARYAEARDLDMNPFRANGWQNAALREIAETEPGVALCDAEAAVAAASAPRPPGFDLFLDYVHPNVRGNLVVAEAVFDAIAREGWLGGPPRVGFRHEPQPFRPDGRLYDEARDLRLQLTLLALFGAMHQHEGAVRVARNLAEHGGGGIGLVRVVLEVFPPWLEAEEARLTGRPLPAAQRARAEAAFRRFYEQQLLDVRAFDAEGEER